MNLKSGVNSSKCVYVGLSGGVDSSVATLLLQRQGFDVVGAFIKGWQPDFMPCTWKEDRQSAMRVAATLGIPFVTVDLSGEYKSLVFDEMLHAYERGLTPNPDVWCNEKIKFGLFAEYAFDRGAAYVATGHYAKRVVVADGEARLYAAKDSDKDQTYFLARIRREVLQKSLFPLGDLEKSDVRRIAKKATLPTADRKDSQGLCFVGALDMKDFLRETLIHEKGDVQNEAGDIVGEHDGAQLYTLGERHGFRTDSHEHIKQPQFVIAKNIDSNVITVGTRDSLVSSRCVTIKEINMLSPKQCVVGDRFDVRFRYRQPLQKAIIDSFVGGLCTFTFDELQETPAPGQLLVFYDGMECVGSGVICVSEA